MKKLLVIIFSLTLFLCGCGKNAEPAVVNGITFTADISVRDKDFTINGAIDKSGIFTASVLAPETIKGLLIYADDTKASVEFMGLKYENEIKNYPVGSIANLIVSSASEENTDSGNIKSGTVKGYDYELQFSDKGIVQKLTVPALQLEVIFKNVQKSE